MSFLQRFFSKLGRSQSPAVDDTDVVVTKDAVWVYLQCNRCGEPIAVRLNKASTLQREDTPDYAWFVKKTIVGSKNRCFNRMQLHLEFDNRFRVVRKELKGGTFISKSEYEASQK